MKRVLSLIVMFALVFSSTFNFAMASPVSNEEILVESDNSVKLIDPENPNTYVVGKDLKDGNVEFSQYRNGKLVSKSVTMKDSRLVKTTIYSSDNSVGKIVSTDKQSDIIEFKELPTFSKTLTTLSGTKQYLGTIRYRYTDGYDSGTCGAKVDYIINSGSIKYDLNGTYRDLAGFAAFIAGIFTLPAAPALGIAKTVLVYFGISLSALYYLIPSYTVDSNYEQIEYLFTDINFSGHTNSFYGTKYVITQKGSNQNEVYYDGNYFAFSPWRNTTFGMTIYTYMFSYGNYSILSWS